MITDKSQSSVRICIIHRYAFNVSVMALYMTPSFCTEESGDLGKTGFGQNLADFLACEVHSILTFLTSTNITHPGGVLRVHYHCKSRDGCLHVVNPPSHSLGDTGWPIVGEVDYGQ